MIVLACALGACGKKGPPLTPFVRIPAGVDALTVRRAGTDVYLTMTLPSANIDGSMPASLARVDVFAATALTPPPAARFLEIATLAGSVPVLPAADPEDPGAVLPPADPAEGAAQGAEVTLRDTLTAEALTPRALPVLENQRPVAAGAGAFAAAPARPAALRRFYMAVPVAQSGRTGPPSAIVELPLTPLPEPPTGLRAASGDGSVSLFWEPSGGLLGYLIDRGLPPERAPFPEPAAPPASATAAVPSSDLPPGPTQYNVYRQIAPDPLALPDPAAAVRPWTIPAPVPVNPAPLAVLTFAEPVPVDERPRCYAVRAVRGTGAARVESEPSAPVCVVPVDVTPPAMPTGVTALPAEGEISLIWEPNGEEDLAGFLVLRRETGSDTLLPLTLAPIPDTRYVDRTVTAGATYTYVIRAVDSRIPLPNVSDPAESAPVTAR